MGLTNMKKNRPILITGKTGTGKSTKAKTLVDDPLVFHGNDIEVKDIFSIDITKGIIIEDIHYKPRKDDILYVIRNYKGQVVLTSINEKSVPKEIKSLCQIKRAGSKKFLRESIKELAPRSEEPFTFERDTYSLVMDYLKLSDRDLVAKLLLYNKPSDTQILSWLCENIHPNKLIFIDGVVKRRWSQRYFYEMLGYVHNGNSFGRITMPKRGTYSKIPYLSRRLGIKNSDTRILKQLLQDDVFKKHTMKKLNNGDCRILGLGEKPRKRKTDPIRLEIKDLSEYFNGE